MLSFLILAKPRQRGVSFLNKLLKALLEDVVDELEVVYTYRCAASEIEDDIDCK